MERIVATGVGFLRDQRGATAVEYGLLCGVFSLGLIAAYTAAGQSIGGILQVAAEALARIL